MPKTARIKLTPVRITWPLHKKANKNGKLSQKKAKTPQKADTAENSEDMEIDRQIAEKRKATRRHGGDNTTSDDYTDGEGPFSDAGTMNRRQKRYTKKVKKARPEQAKENTFDPPPLIVKNKYELLREVNDKPAPNTTRAPNPPAKQQTKTTLPPPIVIHGRPENHQEFENTLRAAAPGGHLLKFTRFRTTVQTNNRKEWQQVCKELEVRKAEFHTYTPKEDKSHSFVLKGLEFNPTPSEVGDELEAIGIPARLVVRMKTKYPIYLVTTAKEVTLRYLQAKHQGIMNTKVTWERYINRTRLIQCFRCQEWGHGRTNCHARIRCPRCAGPHTHEECRINEDEQDKLKCANCEGNHVSSSKDCPIYQHRIEALEKTTTMKQQGTTTRYVAAPAPTTNAWEARASAQAQQQQQQQQQQKESSVRMSDGVKFNQCASSKNVTTGRANSGGTGDLIAAMQEINSNCNVSELARALRDLAAIMAKARDKRAKFMAALEFTERLDEYDI